MSVNIEIVRRLVSLEPYEPDSGVGPNDLPGDWRCVFEERAAIMEYHGNLPRELAEAKALAETVRLMEDEENRRNLGLFS